MILLLMRSPAIVVGIVGFWFAFSRRYEFPRMAKFAMIGFGAALVSVLSFVALQLWIQSAVSSGNPEQVSQILSRWNFVSFPLSVIATVATAVAVFADRTTPSKSTFREESASAA